MPFRPVGVVALALLAAAATVPILHPAGKDSFPSSTVFVDVSNIPMTDATVRERQSGA